MKRMPAKITIDDLAVMMNQQFDRIEKRFEQVDKRFDQVDRRFEQIEQRLDRHDKQFTIINHKLDDLSSETVINREFRVLTEARLRILEAKIA